MTHGPRPGSDQERSSRWHYWVGFLLPAVGVLGIYLFTRSAVREQAWAGEAVESAMIENAEETTPKRAQQGREDRKIAAPELEGGVAWLNTGGPIRMRDLKGKIVLLDFWTLCCINCIHTLPDLARLEKKYPNELVVIGVHSAKFNNEKNSESIRKAILRYEISHPVVNDANMAIWQNFGVQSWPTLYLIDPEGNVVGRGSGEGLYSALDQRIGELIKIHRAKKTLNEDPIRFDLARYRERSESPLYFPGKVLADARSNRLFIADSTNHRVVITDLEGKKVAIAGAGQPGNLDGSFDKALFNDPQGMALAGDTLFVADRKNHQLRALDLKALEVKTIAGTGEQGSDRQRGGKGRATSLNSPWDLHLEGKRLYIAMAGHHQIWVLDLDKDSITPFAGNGREDIFDGPLENSSFAQPSGLASDGTTLYVADSEVSAIRSVPLAGKGEVGTVVGQGLFEFGDHDGTGKDVRLQHALGVAFYEGKLYVADTYNSKIKVLDPARQSSTSFLGGKAKGDAQPLFEEPAGLSFANNKMYVADTNNHRIRVVDMKTKAVETLKLQGVGKPAAAQESATPTFPNPTRAVLASTTVTGTGDLSLEVTLQLPVGTKLNPGAPMTYLAETLPNARSPWKESRQIEDAKTTFHVKVPAAQVASSDGLRLSLLYYECTEGNQGLCRIKSQIWDVPLRFDANSQNRAVRLTGPSVTRVGN